MEPKINLWIEKDGEVVLSRWRVRLLEAVGETGSISRAAGEMGISYRRAWEKIHEMEERLGIRLLDTRTGGVGGGGARLTAAACDLIARFHRFDEGLDEEIRRRFEEAFGSSQSAQP